MALRARAQSQGARTGFSVKFCFNVGVPICSGVSTWENLLCGEFVGCYGIVRSFCSYNLNWNYSFPLTIISGARNWFSISKFDTMVLAEVLWSSISPPFSLQF